MEASFSLCLNYGSMAREIDRSEPEIASDASGGTSERIRTWRGRHQQMCWWRVGMWQAMTVAVTSQRDCQALPMSPPYHFRRQHSPHLTKQHPRSPITITSRPPHLIPSTYVCICSKSIPSRDKFHSNTIIKSKWIQPNLYLTKCHGRLRPFHPRSCLKMIDFNEGKQKFNYKKDNVRRTKWNFCGHNIHKIWI